jgi:hypothetical protein
MHHSSPEIQHIFSAPHSSEPTLDDFASALTSLEHLFTAMPVEMTNVWRA